MVGLLKQSLSEGLKDNFADCEKMLFTSFKMYWFDLLLSFSDKEREQSPLKFSD